MTTNKGKHSVLKAETGRYHVDLQTIISVSTAANTAFDKIVSEFSKRIADSAKTVSASSSDE